MDPVPTWVWKSLGLFLLAGLAEIGGGYLVWQWMRADWPLFTLVIGALALITYGFIPPLQPVAFGRAYAAYGGVFVVLSILWGWTVDARAPHRLELLGGLICLLGVWVIMYAPRSGPA